MALSHSQQSSSYGNLNVVLENPARPPAKRKRHSYQVPQTEEHWQSRRMECGLATPKDILNKIESLKTWDRRKLLPWEKLVVVAATIVDLSTGQDEDTLKFGQVYTDYMSYNTRRRDRAAVLNLIRLLDRLYPNLEHRTFELLAIWDIPLSVIRIWTSSKFEEMYSEFSGNLLEPKKEIQASIPLYIPFLVHLLRPEYSLNTIQVALKTRTLTQDDLELFQDMCKSQQCVPRLLSTLGDFRTPHCQVEVATTQLSEKSPTPEGSDSELGKSIRLDKTYSSIINTHIAGYTTFSISQELQRNASRANSEQEVCNRIKRCNTRIIQYDWTDQYHLPVANQAIDDLNNCWLDLPSLWFVNTVLRLELLNSNNTRLDGLDRPDMNFVLIP
ncbi:hypothetical protein F53441_8432 [Fusarium austroafricanum]|uniref:Uncharacterized protein n=1 Tax=Fusarium austroafricanum TaxID=2364996 RepID=A0A8H4KDM5_9HYPO|nr:hypothetical protein F53441_8432 [Fusarium austroafricanum]